MTQTRTLTAKLETRDIDRDDPKGYDLTGIAVPFDETYTRWGLSEQFDRECEFEGLDRAKLYWQHREAIGKITGHTINEIGLRVDGKISRTSQGDEAATLVRDGVIDSLSIGFEGIEYRVENANTDEELWVWTRVKIREVSLVAFPAYENATLTEVREHNPAPKGHDTMPTTPDILTREDAESRFSELADQIRATQTSVAKLSDTATPHPVQFRTFGEFIRAYHKGEQEARALHTEMVAAGKEETLNARAFDGSVLADTIAKAPWVGDAIRLIDKGRKVLNSFQKAPLPETGSSVEFGKLESNTVQVSKQSKEGDTLAKGQIKVGSDTAKVGTYGGWSELSFQAVERADLSVLNLTRRAQLIAYAKQTELEVRALLTQTIASQISADHKLSQIVDPKAADWISLLIDGADAFEDAALPISGLYLSKDKFKELFTLADSTGRLQFNVHGTGSNVVGELKAPGLEGELGAGVLARLLPGAADGTAAFYNDQAITTWENAGAPTALEDTNVTNLSRAYSVYGYLATGVEIPDAILPIEFEAAG